ncbi:hypothetical protein [Litorimonas sp.]|uniref:hypothetical protein n=1 Tax=Litorimonas sp. TaxID=1892381 RepID=UPI003A88EB6E
MTKEAQHKEFWEWFKENNGALVPDKISDDLQKSVDVWMSKLNIPAWEIGPFTEKPPLSFFAFSPSGDIETFEMSKSITAAAPEIEGWIFLAAKPPKKWNRKFLWSRNEIEIDASNWKFLIYKYDDGLSDIVLIDDVLPNMKLEEKKRIVDFVVESEIGEIGMLTKVYSTDIDTNIDKELRLSATPLTEIKDVLNEKAS